ncbi:MAG TPA: UDP-N-acetylmuramate dehydrogenase [Thermoanaerobaculia bacterium]|nr:UDP-N-acetylmuramate dehydrogenase [Thermoanaerobaculia bacterium]
MPLIDRNVPLAPLTTLGIGGPAAFFTRVSCVEEIAEAIAWARSEGVPWFILGGGSNVLISDDGFKGLVIQMSLRGVVVESEEEHAIVRVAAGESWDAFVERAVTHRWAGVECLSGIPGLVGATPIQNVGAYGQEVSESVIRVEVLDSDDGSVRTLTNSECRFGYRSSIFKTEEGRRFVVLAVTYRLRRGGEATIRYPELRQYVEASEVRGDDLSGVRKAVIAIRRRKGMVLDPGDPDTRSDGSFFMNPVVTGEEHERFVRRARELVGEEAAIPGFPNPDGSVKLSAAWLIERAGFRRGHVHGNVGLSSKHTLAVVNRGGGTAREVLELAGEIQEKVRAAFGVELHPEPKFIGFD